MAANSNVWGVCYVVLLSRRLLIYRRLSKKGIPKHFDIKWNSHNLLIHKPLYIELGK
jgi:hypothetical protein